MKSMRDAMKKRKGQLMIKISVHPADHEDVVGEHEMGEGTMPDSLEASKDMEDNADYKMPNDQGPDLGDEDSMSLNANETAEAESIVSSGREPKGIRQRMLVDQYKKMKNKV